jgi:hypothetical protein
VLIQKRSIHGGITVESPRLIHKRRSRNVNTLKLVSDCSPAQNFKKSAP